MENQHHMLVTVEVEDTKLNKIMERLDKARQEIYDCYNELVDLGIVKIIKQDTATVEQ